MFIDGISKNEALKRLNNSVTYDRGVLEMKMEMRIQMRTEIGIEMFNFT